MDVAARAVNFGTETASGSLVFDSRGAAVGWHVHARHQIAGAIDGAIEVETERARHLVPTGRALLIPADVTHRTTVPNGARSLSVYLDRRALADPGARPRLLTMTPLLRELMAYSDRWPISRVEETDADGAFFQTFAHVIGEALEDDVIVLPTSPVPAVAAAMTFTRDHLLATAADVAHAVGMSERTLRREFEATGVSWRSYQSLARMQRARDLLAQPDVSVLAVALEVGFESASSFARAFSATCGESPGAYRRRVNDRCRGGSHEARSPGPAADGRPPRP
jgi:AraC-like DNA-binding protein